MFRHVGFRSIMIYSHIFSGWIWWFCLLIYMDSSKNMWGWLVIYMDLCYYEKNHCGYVPDMKVHGGAMNQGIFFGWRLAGFSSPCCAKTAPQIGTLWDRTGSELMCPSFSGLLNGSMRLRARDMNLSRFWFISGSVQGPSLKTLSLSPQERRWSQNS